MGLGRDERMNEWMKGRKDERKRGRKEGEERGRGKRARKEAEEVGKVGTGFRLGFRLDR